MKKIILPIVIVASLFLASCNENKKIDEQSNNKINIVTSISPIASVVKYIWGEEVQVNSIVKPWTSPHFFEAKPSDFVKINNADLIFKIGLEFDNFIDKLIWDKNNIVLSSSAKLEKGEDHHHQEHEDEHEEEHHDEDNHHEEHEEEVFYDPHLWLGKDNILTFAELIKEELGKLKEDKKDIFEANFKDFEEKIDKIYTNFEEKIEKKEEKWFIIFHNAYTYLFHDLGIHDEDFAVLEWTVWKEPSAKELKEIIDTIKEKNIKVIYKEPQMDAKLVQTLWEDYNLKVSTLNPLGVSDSKNDYLENLESNLNNLLLRYE